MKVWCVLGLCVGLAGCGVLPGGAVDGDLAASPDHAESASVVSPGLRLASRELFQTPAAGQDWRPFLLPGKTFAPFEPGTWQGRKALQVQARHSVSILRQQFSPALPGTGDLVFSWKIDALPPGADLKDAANADAPVRILLAFDGDRSRWSARTHRLSELSRLLTGEELPYATLSYVWSNADAPGTVLINPRTDRIRKLVVESGSGQLGRWRDYRRDVRADFIQAFGEEPGPLRAVALMTDTDNTRSNLRAWYGALRLETRP